MIIAYGYNKIAGKIQNSKNKSDVKSKVFEVLEKVLKETRRVRFEGNNYDVEWHKEAAKRGLPNTKNTPDALELFLEKDTVNLYKDLGILSERELRSKVEIKLEAYNKTKNIEFKTAINITKTLVLPAVLKQLALLADANSAVKSAGIKSGTISADIKKTDKLYENIQAGVNALEKEIEACEKQPTELKKAKAYASWGMAGMHRLRVTVDAAEEQVGDEFWPMAKYQELLLVL